MKQPPPLPNRRKPVNDWRAVLVTLAYPGAGQFLQGRRTVALLLTGITTVVFLWGVEEMLRGFVEGLSESWNGGPTDLFAALRYAALPWKALGLCYLVSFFDALIAHFRLAGKRGG